MEILVLLFGLAATVWLIPVMQHGRSFVIGLAVLGVGTVFGPSFFHLDGPIQLSLDRILWFGMCCVAAIGLRLGSTRLPPLSRIDWVVIAFVGWTLVSALSREPLASGTPPLARWLFYILMPAGMYAMARTSELCKRDARYLLGGAMALGLYLAITALLEISGLHALVFPRFIADPEVWEFYGRGRGPLMNPSGNGILISIALVATAIGGFAASWRTRFLYAVVTLVLLAGLYATLTRSAWLGGLAAVGIVALVHAPRWTRVLALACAVLVGGASIAGLKDQLVRMKRDKNLTAEDAEKSVQLRPLLAVVAWEMFQDRPIAGHGFGHYFAHHHRYHNDRGYGLPLEQARHYAQHNVFLSLLVDTGLIGCGLLASWLAMLAGIGWRLARQVDQLAEARWLGLLLLGTLLAYCCNGMFQDVMIIPMIHMFVFLIAGAAVTAYQSGLKVSAPSWSQSLHRAPTNVFEFSPHRGTRV